MITIKTFKGNFKLAPGTIFEGYTEGIVEQRGGNVVVASEPGGKNSLEGPRESMLSLANAISEACGVEAAKAAPFAAPAPSVIGIIVEDTRVTVHFNNGSTQVLRKPEPVRFDYVA